MTGTAYSIMRGMYRIGSGGTYSIVLVLRDLAYELEYGL